MATQTTRNNMAAERRRRFPVLLFIMVIFVVNVQAMYVDELEGKLDNVMASDEFRKYFKENIIRVSSWNVRYIPTTTICNFIKKTQPLVFGLQDIKLSRIGQIVGDKPLADCSWVNSRYRVFAGSPNTNQIGRGRYNPIFYKRDRRLRLARGSQITTANGGTFWLSDKPEFRGSKLFSAGSEYDRSATPRICTWLKFTYAERKDVIYRRVFQPFRKILQTLRENIRTVGGTQMSRIKRRAGHRKRVLYKWNYFYVANTRLEYRDPNVTQSQMKILNDYFRKIVLDRRRYPVVFMGDLGITKNSATYSYIQKQKWLNDTSIPSSQRTLERTNTNYIMQTKMQTLLSDTLYKGEWPYQIARPVFAALMTKESPKNTEVKARAPSNKNFVQRN